MNKYQKALDNAKDDIEYVEWKQKNCDVAKCYHCVFKGSACELNDRCWVDHKLIYSNEFLEQKVKIEVPGNILDREQKSIYQQI